MDSATTSLLQHVNLHCGQGYLLGLSESTLCEIAFNVRNQRLRNQLYQEMYQEIIETNLQ